MSRPWQRREFHVALGFFAFGFAISWTAGLTSQAGSGASMLTGFFAFVGGAFVSFSGFQISHRRRNGEAAATTPLSENDALQTSSAAGETTVGSKESHFALERFGRCLGTLSLGIIIGGPAAYLARTSVLVSSEPDVSQGPGGEQASQNDEQTNTIGWVYQTDLASACEYADESMRGKHNPEVAAKALSSLILDCKDADGCLEKAASIGEALESVRAELCTQEPR